MIHITSEDRHFTTHAAEVMQDLILEGNGYTEDDEQHCKKMGQLGSRRGLFVTGEELSRSAATELFQEVIRYEMGNWVPDASQRLIQRAGAALGFGLNLHTIAEDHGDDRGDHALVSDWFVGIYVHRCATCSRLFKA